MPIETETPEPVATPAATPAAPTHHAKDVLSDVAERINGSGEAVRERVIVALVEREVATRTDVLDKGLAKRSELERDIRKIRPDVETFDVDGKTVSQSYTKPKIEERKKLVESLEKLEKALDKAIADNDFGKLKEIVSK